MKKSTCIQQVLFVFILINHSFPSGIISCFTDQTVSENILFEEEKKQAEDYESVRMLDFCRGRYCAHTCCDKIQLKAPILNSVSGAPIWPKGLVGSISHSKNLAGAIVANKSSYKSLGVDIETLGRVEKKLWNLFFTSNEIEFISSANPEEQDFYSTLFFSMKESFYKMQFPITNAFLDFKDCEVVFLENRYFIQLLTGDYKRKLTEMFFFNYKNQVITYTYCIEVEMGKTKTPTHYLNE
ncbi:MAG: 4'-phosphopantetheinyl transferase superfamily protein [Bacteroidota bacterium]